MRMYNRSMLVAGGLALLVTTALVQAQGDTSHYRVLGADNGQDCDRGQQGPGGMGDPERDWRES